MKIIQITDSHLQATKTLCLNGYNTFATLQTCLTHIKQHHADLDLILATGDLSHDGSKQSYQSWLKLVQTLNVPVIAFAGNHDKQKNLLQTFARHMTRQHVILNSQWQLIQLNTVIEDQALGKLTKKSLQRFKTLLELNDNKNIVIAMHHPPIAMHKTWLSEIRLQNHQLLFPFLEKTKNYKRIKAIVCGHFHSDTHHQYEHIKIYTSPSTCFQFTNTTKFGIEQKPPGYRCLALKSNGEIKSKAVYI